MRTTGGEPRHRTSRTPARCYWRQPGPPCGQRRHPWAQSRTPAGQLAPATRPADRSRWATPGIMGLCAACGAELRRPGSLGRRDHAAAPGGPVPRSCFGPARRRLPAGRRAGDAERVPALPAADAGAEVRWAGRRAAGPPFCGAVHDVPLGLVRHMAEVERAGSAAGSPGTTCPALPAEADPDGDFNGAVADPAVVAEAWAAWREEIAFADEFTEDHDLDFVGRLRGRAGLAARADGAHDRGVRPAQRARRPPPRAHRRAHRPVSPARARRSRNRGQIPLPAEHARP